MTSFLPYAHQSITSEDIAEVGKALTGDFITRGPLVEAFEGAVAHYCEAKYAVAFNSGTSALMAAYYAGNVYAFDRLITTPNTFVASAGAGIARQATPVFVDIDRSSGNFDLDQVEINVNYPSSRGRPVVIPVHFAGIPVDMEALDRTIKNPDVLVIEDAAHAIGSTYSNGQKVGCCAWSHMTIFSFHAVKTLTTGEGGMVLTNDESLYHRLRLYRNNGIERDPQFLRVEPAPWYYEVLDVTGNFNFTEMQAALGLSQLKRLDQIVAKRRQLIGTYRQLLNDMPHVKMFKPDYDAQTAYHLCVVQIDFHAYKMTRTEVMMKLKEKGIGSQVHYIPVYRFPFLADKIGDISSYFPQMEAYYSQALSLPLYHDLREEDVERVVSTLKAILTIR